MAVRHIEQHSSTSNDTIAAAAAAAAPAAVGSSFVNGFASKKCECPINLAQRASLKWTTGVQRDRQTDTTDRWSAIQTL